jgi:hypothetical protein
MISKGNHIHFEHKRRSDDNSCSAGNCDKYTCFVYTIIQLLYFRYLEQKSMFIRFKENRSNLIAEIINNFCMVIRKSSPRSPCSSLRFYSISNWNDKHSDLKNSSYSWFSRDVIAAMLVSHEQNISH